MAQKSFLNRLARPVMYCVPFLLIGCFPTTTFKGADHCRAYLNAGDKILLSPLPYDNWAYQLEDIRKEFADRNVSVLYAPEEEFNLRAAGIANPFDSSGFPMLKEKGITHVLTIGEFSSKDGSFIQHKTPLEVSREQNPYRSVAVKDETKSAVEIAVDLFSLDQMQRYAFNVTTNVSGAEVGGDDGGRTTVNMGGLTKARNVAIRKAMKKVAEECR